MPQALDISSGNSSGGQLDADDILDVLNAPDATDDKIKDTKGDEGEKPNRELEADIPEDESEEKDEEPETEEVELDENATFEDVPKRKEILAAFPELFKKFPGVEKAIYREQQYTEVFPTPAEAKEASEKLSSINTLEDQLLSGSMEGLLSQVKNADPEAFSKIASTALQTIGKIDPNAQASILKSILSETLQAAFKNGSDADSEDGKQLAIAAQYIHRWIFGSHKIVAQQQQAQNQPDPREQNLTQREQRFQQQQFNIALNEVSGRVDNSIKSWTERNLDPKEVMTPYVKSKAINDVLEQVKPSIMGDTRFKAYYDKLWQECIRSDYSESSKSKIKSALLQRAKAVLPAIVSRVKADALKGLATRSKEANTSRDEAPVRSGRPATSRSSSKDDGPKQGESAIDYLMRD